MGISVSGIKNGIVSGFGTACTAVKDSVVWCGRKISAVFNNYIVPAVKAAWQGTKKGFEKTVAFFRTGYGLGSLAGVTSIALIAAAQSSALEGDDNRWLRYGLFASGIISAVGAGYLLAKGSTALI